MISIKDASGNDVSTNTTHIAYLNPIRYRSYYYDVETGFYYLNSRYYDPAICRFISSDALLVVNPAIYGLNLFAYCGNDPVNKVDPSGYLPDSRLLANALACENGTGKFHMLGCYDNHHSGHDNPNPKEVVDITNDLNNAMIDNRLKFEEYIKTNNVLDILLQFYDLSRSGSEWDLKDKWDLDRNAIYVYNNSTIEYQDVGNIHFGYVGSSLFSLDILQFGAGLYQIYSRTSQFNWGFTYFDDPQDTHMIAFGYFLYGTYGYDLPQ